MLLFYPPCILMCSQHPPKQCEFFPSRLYFRIVCSQAANLLALCHDFHRNRDGWKPNVNQPNLPRATCVWSTSFKGFAFGSKTQLECDKIISRNGWFGQPYQVSMFTLFRPFKNVSRRVDDILLADIGMTKPLLFCLHWDFHISYFKFL